jgi:hypothetical protein
LKLKAATPSVAELLSRLWQEWITAEGWHIYSVNFVVGGPRLALVLPALAVGAWMSLSCLLYAGLTLVRRWPWRMQPFAVFFLVGWLALDARWQWDLWQQLQATYAHFAGKNWQERKLSDRDGELYQFIQDVKQKLPHKPVRVFVASADLQGDSRFNCLRAQYHLAPHNAYACLEQPPASGTAHPGDYLLILQPAANISYSSEEKVLHWDQNETLAVEPIHIAEAGVLFRVRAP